MRIRTIKPGFWENERLAMMLVPCPGLLFQGLWMLADREGRLEDRPERIRIKVFPYHADANVDAFLSILESERFVTRYTTESGDKYLQINKFAQHQKPHPKEAPSTIPAPGREKVIPCRENASLNPEKDPPFQVVVPLREISVCGKEGSENGGQTSVLARSQFEGQPKLIHELIPPQAPRNPLVQGRRPELELEALRLCKLIADATDRDSTEVMAEASHYPGAQRQKCNPATMSDDRLISTLNDLRADWRQIQAKANSPPGSAKPRAQP